MRRGPRWRIGQGLLVICLAGFAFATGNIIGDQLSPGDRALAHVPTNAAVGGRSLQFLYFGASDCEWANHPDLQHLLDRSRQLVREQARVNSEGFSTLGVALDYSVARGYDHLQNLGPFDEISIGFGWANSAAIRHLWAPTLIHPPGTPAVVVLSRRLTVPSSGNVYQIYTESEVVPEITLIGLEAIRAWANDGAPLVKR